MSLCKITVDNKQNNFPVIVRIWSIAKQPKPARTFTVNKAESFITENLSPPKGYSFLHSTEMMISWQEKDL